MSELSSIRKKPEELEGYNVLSNANMLKLNSEVVA